MQIDPAKRYVAIMHTEKGDIQIELFAQQAPKTVNNFVFLAREGFYNGTTFHRVIRNFMSQGGDPTGSGRGGPGYSFNDDSPALPLKHDSPGILPIPKSRPNPIGSQSVTPYTPTPLPNATHAAFPQPL